MKEETQKLVKVTWVDVVEITSPVKEITDYKKQLAVIESVGYILQNDSDILALAKERFEGKPEQILVIPKSLVKGIKKVGKLKDVPKEWIRKHPEEFKSWYGRVREEWAVEELPLEETENEIRARIQDPSKYDSNSFRRKPFPPQNPKKGIFAIYACPKGNWSGGRCQVGMQIQSLRFMKSAGWTITKAGAWLKGHSFKII